MSPRRPPVAAIAHAHSERSEQGAMARAAGQRGRPPRRLSGVVGAHPASAEFCWWRERVLSKLLVLAQQRGFTPKIDYSKTTGSVYVRLEHRSIRRLIFRISDHRSRGFVTQMHRRVYAIRPGADSVLHQLTDKIARCPLDSNRPGTLPRGRSASCGPRGVGI